MLSSARGRIVFWEGASMWVLSPGSNVGEEGIKGTVHSHHAVQVTFALEGWYRLESGDQSVDTPVAAVAPDARHAITANGTMAFVYMEPESIAGRAAVRRLFSKRRLASVDPALFGSLHADLLAAYRDPAPTLPARALSVLVDSDAELTQLASLVQSARGPLVDARGRRVQVPDGPLLPTGVYET